MSKARKFSAKQIRYLWAIGYLKTSPHYKGPEAAKQALKTGKRQSLSAPTAIDPKDIQKISDDIYGKHEGPIRKALKSPDSKESQDLFKTLLKDQDFLDNQYPSMIQAMKRVVGDSLSAPNEKSQVKQPVKKIDFDKFDWSTISDKKSLDDFKKSLQASIFEDDNGKPKKIHFEDRPSKEYDQMLYLHEKADYKISDSRTRDLFRSQIESVLIEHSEKKVDSILEAINQDSSQLIQTLKKAARNDEEPDIGYDDYFSDHFQNRVKMTLRTLSKYIPLDTLGGNAFVSVSQNTTNREYYSKDTLSLSEKSRDGVIAHEYAHFLEDQSPTWKRLADKFVDDYAMRDRGLHKLSKITGNPTYGDQEVAYLAKPGIHLSSPYVLKAYSPQTSHSEVFSMGVERLIEEPFTFYRTSPEHFRATLVALHTPLLKPQN